jgi:23S rRNA (cytidine1920-2'-O)/16S rRNA (cytidine1409-2'-O)-methyltransferase
MPPRRRLDAELVRRGLSPDLSGALALIDSGRVLVGGAPALEPTRQVAPGDSIALRPAPARFVSRGGEKLSGALDAFGIDVTAMRALDAGASTGGFTDCLLQRGAACVIAVDVGHGLLAWKLQQDPRVVVLDRTNVRSLTPDVIGGPVDLVVADLSFIGLRTVAPALVACAAPGATFVLLVKPQFEAPREGVGSGGIVRDPEVRRRVLHEIVAGLSAAGLIVEGVVRSSITGATGNVEYLVRGSAGGQPVDPSVIDALIDEEVDA